MDDLRVEDGTLLEPVPAGGFNVLKDASLRWQGVHLVDSHAGDPDSADIELMVPTNALELARIIGSRDKLAIAA